MSHIRLKIALWLLLVLVTLSCSWYFSNIAKAKPSGRNSPWIFDWSNREIWNEWRILNPGSDRCPRNRTSSLTSLIWQPHCDPPILTTPIVTPTDVGLLCNNQCFFIEYFDQYSFEATSAIQENGAKKFFLKKTQGSIDVLHTFEAVLRVTKGLQRNFGNRSFHYVPRHSTTCTLHVNGHLVCPDDCG